MTTYDAYKEIVGLEVLGADGRRLGKVLECGEQKILVEKGNWLHKDFFIDYADVVRVEKGQVFLSKSGRYYLQRGEPSRSEGPSADNSANTAAFGAQAKLS